MLRIFLHVFEQMGAVWKLYEAKGCEITSCHIFATAGFKMVNEGI